LIIINLGGTFTRIYGTNGTQFVHIVGVRLQFLKVVAFDYGPCTACRYYGKPSVAMESNYRTKKYIHPLLTSSVK